jgi:hypothetical protein
VKETWSGIKEAGEEVIGDGMTRGAAEGHGGVQVGWVGDRRREGTRDGKMAGRRRSMDDEGRCMELRSEVAMERGCRGGRSGMDKREGKERESSDR